MKKKRNIYQKMSITFFVFSIIGIFIWAALFAANNLVSKDTVYTISNSISGREKLKEKINFLIVGTNENLTDSIIYGRYNTETNRLYLMSIPRDTYTVNKDCNGHKINSIYRGKNLDSFLGEIEQLLLVTIDYYAIYDNSFIKEVVNSVGGVEIYVPQKMSCGIGEPQVVIELEEGTQVLDGDKAEVFLRFREGYANADLGRVEAQRNFIKAFIGTITSKKNITKIPSVIKIALENTKTNATTRELMKYIDEIKEINIDEIESITMPNTPKYINGLSYVIADKEEARRIIREEWDKRIIETQNDN